MSDKEFKTRKINSDDGFIMSPKNDFAFKLIFGDEKNIDLLIELLSVILKIDKVKFANIRLINTELNREFAEDRKGILDVRAKMSDGTEIDIEIDEEDKVIQWMMFLEAKSKEVLDMLGEKNVAIKKATSILEIMSHDEDTRRAYDAREAALHDEVTKIQEAEENIKLQNAKNLLLMGISVDIVSQGIGLDIEIVKEIKRELDGSKSVSH